MSGHYEAPIREPLIIGHKTYHDITEDIARPIEERAGKLWWVSLYAALVLFVYGFGCIAYTIGTGIGAWGLNRTINWGWDITNFVWWVGIGHAGTLISAVLLLFRQRWRMSVNRSAEAMTIFAVCQAAIFPVIHMGRVWVGYWVFRCQTSLDPFGLTSTHHYFGTYLRSLPISRYQWYSGLWD